MYEIDTSFAGSTPRTSTYGNTVALEMYFVVTLPAQQQIPHLHMTVDSTGNSSVCICINNKQIAEEYISECMIYLLILSLK